MIETATATRFTRPLINIDFRRKWDRDRNINQHENENEYCEMCKENENEKSCVR